MNVASRIETTGIAGRIHVSQDTAEHLRKCNKGHWLVKREGGTVVAKGKGDIETYWIGKAIERMRRSPSIDETSSESASSDTRSVEEVAPCTFGEELTDADGREDRLVDWNVTIFADIMKQVVARRNAYAAISSTSLTESSDEEHKVVEEMKKGDFKPLHDVKETIFLPKFNRAVEELQEDPHTIEIPKNVTVELRDFVSTIAGLYRSNPFHNFEHASHVTMSVIKLLSRIKAPTDLEMMEVEEHDNEDSQIAKAQLHDHTYGITSDPLTQFACAFAALIHDVDHEGKLMHWFMRFIEDVAHVFFLNLWFRCSECTARQGRRQCGSLV